MPEGKLDLPELCETPSSHELAWGRSFIAARRWREAVTYRHTAPHEYVVRKWERDDRGQAEFDQFVVFIRRFGRAEFYHRLRHLYWSVDDHKYWTMGWPVNKTIVINRARLDAPEPWKGS